MRFEGTPRCSAGFTIVANNRFSASRQGPQSPVLLQFQRAAAEAQGAFPLRHSFNRLWLVATRDISINKHGSHVVAVVAHHDCAGNPVAKEQQLHQLALAINMINEWGYDAEVLGLWGG